MAHKNTTSKKKPDDMIATMQTLIAEILDTLGAPVAVSTNYQGEPVIYFVFGMPEDEIRKCAEHCIKTNSDLLQKLTSEGALAIRVKNSDIIPM